MEMMTPPDMPPGLRLRARWQLYWAHCRNSSPSPWYFSWQPSLMEKHDSSPLIQTPVCHSEVNRQIIHQWDCIPPPLPLPLPPPLNQQRQQYVLRLARNSFETHFKLISPWYPHGNMAQVFEGVTLIKSSFLIMHHTTYLNGLLWCVCIIWLIQVISVSTSSGACVSS